MVAGSVAYRFFVRRPPAPAVPEPHAAALKSKLAESRVVADEAESVPPDLGDRRASVHERGREAAEQMRQNATSPE